MSRYRPAREIRNIVGAAAAAVIPDEYGETIPCPVRAGDALVLRVVFFPSSGPPSRRVVLPPRFVVDVDGERAAIVRLARCTPDEVGVVPPLAPVPGAGVEPTAPVDDFVRRRERLLDLAPAVWEAFAAGATAAPGAVGAGEVREFYELLLSITTADVAPFYPAVAPEFFRWVRATAGAP